MDIDNRVIAAARTGLLYPASKLEPDLFPHVDVSDELRDLIAVAELLSAGEPIEDRPVRGSGPPRLISIFDRIALPGYAAVEKTHEMPLSPLSLEEEALFPISDRSSADTDDRRNLLKPVAAAANAGADDAAQLETLQAALRHAAWRIPAGYSPRAQDVSLYDHCRTTAALAACLHRLDGERLRKLLAVVRKDFSSADSIESQPDPELTRDEHALMGSAAVLLVGGDISGIQDFIYTLSSKNAAKTLRGRSFYLQLLTEAVLRFALRELGLPYTNVIYSGGGHFFLLAPPETEEKLPMLANTISRKLLRHHGAALYLAIGSAPVAFSDFRLGKFPEAWSKMHRGLAAAKARRFSELGEELHRLIFTPPVTGGDPRSACSVCGEDQRPSALIDAEQPDRGRICSLCASFSDELGGNLPRARFVALGLGEPQDLPKGTAAAALASFGMQAKLIADPAQIVELPGAKHAAIWAFDDPDSRAVHTWPLIAGLPAAHWQRYTVSRIPQNRDEKRLYKPLEFDELAEKADGGFERLGVLRMDVDDLGDVFKTGLGAGATLARLSTLSFQLSLFFEGRVKRISESGRFENLIYAVYAGGDDAFLIGPWDRMPALAKQIRDDFAAFTGANPSLRLSAGLALIGGKYPVYQAAADAAEALEAAKAVAGKNAFCFLNFPWTWPVFEAVEQKFERVLHLVGGDGEGLDGPQALIDVLRRMAVDEERKARRLKTRPVWGRWMWQGVYLIKRMAERSAGKNPELAKELTDLQAEIFANDFADVRQWGYAARWAQLKTRRKDERDRKLTGF